MHGDIMYKERLKNLRDEMNLKQYDIAKVLNISPTLYNNYENEYQIIPIKHLNKLCEHFNISLDYIFNFNNLKKYDNNKEIDINKMIVRLKEFRKENKLTQEQLAKSLNVVKGTIGNYESSRNLIATPFLYDICKKYHISADYLLGKTDSPKYLK